MFVKIFVAVKACVIFSEEKKMESILRSFFLIFQKLEQITVFQIIIILNKILKLTNSTHIKYIFRDFLVLILIEMNNIIHLNFFGKILLTFTNAVVLFKDVYDNHFLINITRCFNFNFVM